MILSDESTWPPELLAALEQRRAVFLDKELRATKAKPSGVWDWQKWDAAIYEMCEIMRPFTLRGYHCTRLTEAEIEEIKVMGMSPPNHYMLKARITALVKSGVLSPSISRRLLAKNQAKERNRANRIWFCFYPPRLAGQPAIERFFRSWGGEALYNSHEDDHITGPVLQRIGTPCLIEAEVPVSGIELRISLVTNTARQFLINRGLETGEPCEHEDPVIRPLSAASVVRIICHRHADFLSLTGCEDWDPPL